ncbi:hypothetical protein N7G274_007983 [Stereocaulon virgatum]|uniref:WD40 repeat-like protein n=1 Tax=Stereocaulon virgatum TaxID=373712 RepID=A0ABR4A2N4_9LECA
MGKRKRETADPEHKDQNGKKPKTGHEELVAVAINVPTDASDRLSQVIVASSKAEGEGEASKHAGKRARRRLKKALKEGGAEERSGQEQHVTADAEARTGAELQEKIISTEEPSKKQRRTLKKGRREAGAQDSRAQVQTDAPTGAEVTGVKPPEKISSERNRLKKQRKNQEAESQAQEEMGDEDKVAGMKLVERDKSKGVWAKEQRIASKRAQKKGRTFRKRSQEPAQTDHEKQLAGEELGGKDKSRMKGHRAKGKHKYQGKNLKTPNDGPVWKISDPIGGHMRDLDPLFSQDEKYLLIAYNAVVAIYSTSTSLPIRQLRIKKADSISGFAFSSENSSHLYISTVSGTIERWDWVEGTRTGHWTLASSVYALVTSSRGLEESTRDLVYTVDSKHGEPWLLSAHRLARVDDATNSDAATLLKYDEPISSIKVLERGRVIVAASRAQLIIGYCKNPITPDLRDLSYTWRIVECPEWIAGFDVRTRHRMVQNQAEKKGMVSEAIDVAIGGLKGSIYIYEDLLNQLIHRERRKDSIDIISRRLHWHRNSVLTIKWSLDGNYLISGGQETTLVLWQLETGQRQHLPHLGAPIESIVVSPSGSSYSVRLADNSAMILSTTELKPTFSISGIQIPSTMKSSRIELPFTPTIDTPVQCMKPAQRLRFAACMSSGSLLLAVPPSVTSRQTATAPQNSSYLQTFDIGGGQHISRQALTRTKVTDLNMGPESNTIEEPHVAHIQASADGQWLATVDEWMPPRRDLAPLAFDQERVVEERISRQEVFLKFWCWKEETKIWELVSRIENPHASQSGNPYDKGRVLELASDPSTTAFATIGEDGIVKTWRPAIRRRHGLEVRSKDGISLTTWHCKHAILLEATDIITEKSAQGAKLAYSQDGSVLAAGLQMSTPSPIYLIDAYSGEIRSVQTGSCSGPLLGLGIIDKYLIILSFELCVWNLVTDERQYGIQLKENGLPCEKQIVMMHLAVDAQNGLFAIAVPQVGKVPNMTPRSKSQVAVFEPANASPVLLTSLPNAITNLLPAARRKGFHTIDSAAEVRTLTPSQSSTSVPMALPEYENAAFRGLTNIFGNGQTAKAVGDGAGKLAGLLTSNRDSTTRELRVQRDDAVVVSADRLAELFNVKPAYALPPVTKLFEQVASLYNGRVR